MLDHGSQVRLVGSSRKEGDVLVAAVVGDVDLHNSPRLRLELMQLISLHKPKRVVLNLAQVPY
ncbi:MAG: STAS domain-containing protein, partial [Tepidisphaerales bacterium]